MKFVVEPMREEDYEKLMSGSTVDLSGLSQFMKVRGPAYTGRIDDEIAICAGVLIPWPGLGEAWAVLSDLGRQHPLFVHRRVARVLRSIIRECHLNRIQCGVDISFSVGREWVERLGFRPESVMPQYGPKGETFVRYVIFP
jgi:hypothetical protein